MLLYGPPGCGKTFMAKATAGECRAAFFPIHIADILDKYIGVSEQNLRDLFDNARAHKPSILFFDEIDTVGFNRSKSSSSMRGMIDTFLAEMEGIDTSTDQLLVIGATNMPWDVDDALKRPGRFDRLVFVSPPDEEAREHMFRLKLEGRYIENIDTVRLASRTEFSPGRTLSIYARARPSGCSGKFSNPARNVRFGCPISKRCWRPRARLHWNGCAKRRTTSNTPIRPGHIMTWRIIYAHTAGGFNSSTNMDCPIGLE